MINIFFIVALRVVFKISSKCASVNPLLLKPQSPGERLAAQQRDHAEGEAAQELAEEARGKGKG